jgi:signal peptide peptidase SppA
VSKFKITKYKNQNITDESYFKLLIPVKKQANPVTQPVVQQVLNTKTNPTNVDQTEEEGKNDQSQEQVQEQVPVQQNDTLGKRLIRTLSCGYFYKLVHSKDALVLEDIETKRKKYLLYKFNNFKPEESEDMIDFKKSDPFKSLKDFTEIVYNSFDPNDVEIILDVLSPGGSVLDFEEVYSYVNRLTKKGFKITGLCDVLGASGGMMLLAACQKIVCSEYAQVGSVGVIAVGINYYELAKKMGIIQKTFKTGTHKAGFPSGEEFTDEDIQRMNEMMDKTFKMFAKIVQDSRKLTDEEMKDILTAKVYYGNEALEKKLVDQVMLSIDYLNELEKSGDVYVIKADKTKKSLFNEIFKLSTISDTFLELKNVIAGKDVIFGNHENRIMVKLE